jgi:glutamate synthase domain-containing protein 2
MGLMWVHLLLPSLSLLIKMRMSISVRVKGGQGAKTGTGGHLPGNKNIGKISEVRGIPEGQAAVSPPTFQNLTTVEDFKQFADRVREVTGGIPIGFKLSANHIEEDYREMALLSGVSFSGVMDIR